MSNDSCMVSKLHTVILRCLGARVVMWECEHKPKQDENMMEAGKGGWRGCYAALGRLGRLVELRGHVLDGWEEWGCSRGALDGVGAGTVRTRLCERGRLIEETKGVIVPEWA